MSVTKEVKYCQFKYAEVIKSFTFVVGIPSISAKIHMISNEVIQKASQGNQPIPALVQGSVSHETFSATENSGILCESATISDWNDLLQNGIYFIQILLTL